MAYSALLTLANASYPNQAGDGSYYASAQLDVHLNTDLIFSYTPVISGPAAPFLFVYAVDLIGNLIPVGNLTLAAPFLVLGAGAGRAFGAKIQVKAFAGLSTPPVQFALSIEAKGTA